MRKIILALVVIAGTTLNAQQTRPDKNVTIDFTQTLYAPDGKPVQNGKDIHSPFLTLGDVSVMSLETITDEDRAATGLDKFKRDQLARKIYNQPAVPLTAEDITLIKERIGIVYGPVVVGAAWPLLDPNAADAR